MFMIVDIIFVSKPLRNRMIVIMYNILHVHVWSDAKTGFILIICNMEFFILFTALYWSTYSNKQIFITIILLRYEWIMLFSAIDRVKRKVAIVRIYRNNNKKLFSEIHQLRVLSSIL